MPCGTSRSPAPDRYPEYLFDDGRLDNAIAHARAAGEILPPISGSRDEPLFLRIDQDRDY